MGVRRALSCFHSTPTRCKAPHCSSSCPCASPHTSLVQLPLSSHQHLGAAKPSPEECEPRLCFVPGTCRGVRELQLESLRGGIVALLHRQQHSLGTSSWIRGCKVPYMSYRLGGKDTSPEVQFVPLTPFFYIIIIIAVTLVCLGPVCCL